MAKQKQDEEDDKHEAEASHWPIAPGRAVWPPRSTAEEHEDKDDDEDCGEHSVTEARSTVAAGIHGCARATSRAHAAALATHAAHVPRASPSQEGIPNPSRPDGNVVGR